MYPGGYTSWHHEEASKVHETCTCGQGGWCAVHKEHPIVEITRTDGQQTNIEEVVLEAPQPGPEPIVITRCCPPNCPGNQTNLQERVKELEGALREILGMKRASRMRCVAKAALREREVSCEQEQVKRVDAR
jgi:hypothetical protein